MNILSWRWPQAFAVIFSLSVMFMLGFMPRTAIAQSLSFGSMKSIDVMKYTKDVVANQQSDAVIQNLVSTLKPLGVTHVAISIPMDDTEDYPGASTPSPRTVEEFTQKWADAIHAAGLKIIWRGTFSGIEGIYNFTKKVGADRFPAGTAASAETDGTTSWLGKIYRYIVSHPDYFANGDVWAPLPERTEGIFSDSTSFLPHDGAGIQTNYGNFFKDLMTVSTRAFGLINKSVSTGLTANNYSEVSSGWLPQSLFDSVGYLVIDHYGVTHTPAEMDSDIRRIATSRGKKVFLQEWGDYWTSSMTQEQRSEYLRSMYTVLQKLANEGILVGFNSWTGWAGAQESILTLDSSGFHLNFAGEILKTFFGGSTPAVASTTNNTVETNSGTSGTSTTTLTSTTSTVVPTVSEPTSTGYTSTTNTGSGTTGTISTGSNDPTFASNSPTCPGAADGLFTGCYYRDTTLTSLAITRTDLNIDFDWGLGTPDASMLSDNFSAKWQGYINFDSGDYEFAVNSDDGIRLYIDGVRVIDAWYPQTATQAHTYRKNMSQGKHLVVVEYYEATGAAAAKLKWTKLSNLTATNGFTGQYYRGSNLQRLLLTRNEPKIDFGWGSGSPDPSVPDDNFSVRWQGNFEFTSGQHTFYVTADDGARLYIDGKLTIDVWRDQPMKMYQAKVELGAGVHAIKLEYYERSGNASARLTWD